MIKRYERFLAAAALLLAMLTAGTGNAAQRREISAASDAKTAAFFEKILEEHLASALPDTVSEYRILGINISGNRNIPEKFDDYRLNILRASKGMENMAGEAVFYNNGSEIMKLGFSARVEVLFDAVVAAKRIPKGTAITDEMLKVEKVKLHGAAGDFCTDLAEAVGQVAERSIQPNRPVAKADLAAGVDVKAGDLILLVAKNDEVKLTTRGVAKKDGSIGELIPVLNLRSNKKLFGKVVDAGTVQVNF